MTVLLDTHALLWWLEGHKDLPDKILTLLKNGQTVVFVSAATAWEIAIKKALGKLNAPDDLESVLESNRFFPLQISIRHALAAGKLPRHHDDPFDRMLIAQAQLENLPLITQDPRFKQYKVKTLWG